MDALSPAARQARLVNAEHEVQISLVNEVRDILHRGQDASETIERLKAWSWAHFESEQLLMRQYDFPDYDVHAAEHRKMLDALAGLTDAAAVDALSIVLRRHIRERDSKLHAFLDGL